MGQRAGQSGLLMRTTTLPPRRHCRGLVLECACPSQGPARPWLLSNMEVGFERDHLLTASLTLDL